MEDVFVVVTVFSAILLFTKLILDHLKEKHRIRASANSGSSLTSSELKQLMREALDDVMDDRFGRLEQRLDEMQNLPLLTAGKERREEIDAPPAPPVARDRDLTR